jgi:hypothetical protein
MNIGDAGHARCRASGRCRRNRLNRTHRHGPDGPRRLVPSPLGRLRSRVKRHAACLVNVQMPRVAACTHIPPRHWGRTRGLHVQPVKIAPARHAFTAAALSLRGRVQCILDARKRTPQLGNFHRPIGCDDAPFRGEPTHARKLSLQTCHTAFQRLILDTFRAAQRLLAVQRFRCAMCF